MTRKQLLQEIEAYYGSYARPAQRAYVAAWIATQREGHNLLQLWHRVIEEFSSRYGTPPDVADLRAVSERIDDAYIATPEQRIAEKVDRQQQIAAMTAAFADLPWRRSRAGCCILHG